MSFLRWLSPGIEVKRWLGLLGVGIAVIGLGLGYVLRDIYDYYTFPEWVYYATLQFLPRWVRAVLFLAAGSGLIALGLYKLNRSLLSALQVDYSGAQLLDNLYRRRYLKRGPRVVAVGGGTGLSTLLRGLKNYTAQITAVVTVADDGGSSGRLREELGILPPGDIRNCITALATAEPLMTRLFEYRFKNGGGLEGHSFGNLFIAALTEVTGSFEKAVLESGRVLAVQGQVLPATLADIQLCAELETGEVIRGESKIPKHQSRIRRVFLVPPDPPAYAAAVQAILDADLVVLGPGSLYTSVLPNLMVSGIREALRATRALRVYVCNVATQKGETDNFTVADHVRTLLDQAGAGVIDCVLANSLPAKSTHPDWEVIKPEPGGPLPPGIRVVWAPVINERNPHFHDPDRLARALLDLYFRHRRSLGRFFPVGVAHRNSGG